MRVVGHLDFDVFNEEKLEELRSFKMDEIQKILELLRNFLNKFSSYFFDSTTAYKKSFTINDGDALIEDLKRAIHYEELVQNQNLKPYSLSNSKYKNA